eukprot:Em0003g1664a
MSSLNSIQPGQPTLLSHRGQLPRQEDLTRSASLTIDVQYPPHGGANPTQGGVYYPLGGANPPQEGSYPPQGRAYHPHPPQPGYVGYIPPQPGYSPAQPPPAYYPQAGAQQQYQQVTRTIETVQPKATTKDNISYIRTLVDSSYNISIALTLMCFFCGSWFVLCCTVPAMFEASSAKEALEKGQFKKAKRSGLKALVLIIASLVFYVISLIVIIVLTIHFHFIPLAL